MSGSNSLNGLVHTQGVLVSYTILDLLYRGALMVPWWDVGPVVVIVA